MGKSKPEVMEVEVGGERLVVISMPATAVDEQVELTASERRIAADILAGLSNREISSQRGTSIRTVANQIASLYRKLGVTSRSELVALLTR